LQNQNEDIQNLRKNLKDSLAKIEDLEKKIENLRGLVETRVHETRSELTVVIEEMEQNLANQTHRIEILTQNL